jgi:hypothetical protein
MQAPQRTVADLVAAYSRSDIARRDAAWVEALVAEGALSAADRVMVGTITFDLTLCESRLCDEWRNGKSECQTPYLRPAGALTLMLT